MYFYFFPFYNFESTSIGLYHTYLGMKTNHILIAVGLDLRAKSDTLDTLNGIGTGESLLL